MLLVAEPYLFTIGTITLLKLEVLAVMSDAKTNIDAKIDMDTKTNIDLKYWYQNQHEFFLVTTNQFLIFHTHQKIISRHYSSSNQSARHESGEMEYSKRCSDSPSKFGYSQWIVSGEA